MWRACAWGKLQFHGIWLVWKKAHDHPYSLLFSFYQLKIGSICSALWINEIPNKIVNNLEKCEKIRNLSRDTSSDLSQLFQHFLRVYSNSTIFFTPVNLFAHFSLNFSIKKKGVYRDIRLKWNFWGAVWENKNSTSTQLAISSASEHTVEPR